MIRSESGEKTGDRPPRQTPEPRLTPPFAMQGQLNEIDIYSLLQLIELGQRTGDLWIEAHDSWLLSFAHGRIVHASPAQVRAERLQDFLHRLYPKLAAESIHDPAALHLPEYAMLGSLIAQKCLTLKQGQTLVTRLVDETLFDLLSLYSGTFRFEMGVLPPTQLATLEISLHLRLVKQQLQAWKQLYPLVEHPEQYPIIIKPERLSRQLSGSAFKNLARWADGTVSLRQLARRLNRPMTAVAQAIYPFLEAHLIQLKPSPHPKASFPGGSETKTPKPSPPQCDLDAGRAESKNGSRDTNSRGSIVCIDDSTVTLETLHRSTQPLGYDMTPFTDALTALDHVLRHPPDAIFCEIDMPILNGYEFCAMLRQTHRFHHRPIIMLTRKDGFADRAQARLAGASDYLTKPFSTDELRMLLEKYIDPGCRP
ncbi:MAG: response regulator [Synechococcales cyanobacterium CRU_2_2]|nr:response regulator [Synechococcales cyanobacterium CRU_2_2]